MVWLTFGLGVTLGVVGTALYLRWRWEKETDKLTTKKDNTKH